MREDLGKLFVMFVQPHKWLMAKHGRARLQLKTAWSQARAHQRPSTLRNSKSSECCTRKPIFTTGVDTNQSACEVPENVMESTKSAEVLLYRAVPELKNTQWAIAKEHENDMYTTTSTPRYDKTGKIEQAKLLITKRSFQARLTFLCHKVHFTTARTLIAATMVDASNRELWHTSKKGQILNYSLEGRLVPLKHCDHHYMAMYRHASLETRPCYTNMIKN